MSEAPKRGRPVEVDPALIAAQAVTLFTQRGYEGVTMDDVALAVGVSRRTLFRHFPSKGDLVWGDFSDLQERLQEVLSQPAEGTPVLDRVRLAYSQALTFPADQLEVTRLRMVIIGGQPGVFAEGFPLLDGLRSLVADFFAQRQGIKRDGLHATVAASALISAAMTALIWWARYSDADPRDVVDEALAEVARGLAL